MGYLETWNKMLIYFSRIRKSGDLVDEFFKIIKTTVCYARCNLAFESSLGCSIITIMGFPYHMVTAALSAIHNTNQRIIIAINPSSSDWPALSFCVNDVLHIKYKHSTTSWPTATAMLLLLLDVVPGTMFAGHSSIFQSSHNRFITDTNQIDKYFEGILPVTKDYFISQTNYFRFEAIFEWQFVINA